MPVKVAINGFGRIGRLVLRAIVESGREDVVPVAINDLGSVEANAHLFAYDSVHGRFPGQIEVSGNTITIRHNGKVYGPLTVSAERDPTKVPYQGVDVALECTGIFTSKAKASALLTAGARKVLISAPADEVDATIVYGVNHKTLTKEMTVVSNASCTTNCLAPMAKVLHDRYGILRGYMVTIHAYTGDQNTVDTLHKRPASRARGGGVGDPDLDRCGARGGPGAAGAEGQAGRHRDPHPDAERFAGVAGREPGEAGDEGRDQRGDAGRLEGRVEGHPGLQHARRWSAIDFNHSPASCTFDATQTAVVDGALTRVMGWYDNEWGFSNRMSDTAALFGSL